GTTGGSVTGGKSPSVLNRLLQDSRLTVEQGVPALHTLPFITSSVTASPLDPGVDSLVWAAGPVMTEATTIATVATVATTGFEMNDGRLCADMIDHFTPPAFFKTVRGMEHEQLFTKFNVSATRNLSLSSEVRMRAEYNILEKRKWRTLAEEKNILLGAKDKDIEDLKSQLLKAKE
ncbi:hypothetical protein Tco_0292414, partial [Tanacetum coccineum]